MKVPVPPLAGTLEAAQSYVDDVTCSYWWLTNCKPLFNGQVATKVLVEESDRDDLGAEVPWDEDEDRRYYNGRLVPLMRVGHHPSYADTPAIADPLVLLHELAHVWEWKSYHNKEFHYAFAKLVKQFLGIKHHSALVEAMKDHRIRLNYRSIMHG